MNIIFLDIDGVLNGHERHDNGYRGMRADCVAEFNRLLRELPGWRIVISSAWRYLAFNCGYTVAGFESLLLTHGVSCKGRIEGWTREDSPEVDQRIDQIRDWISANKVDQYLILDDMPIGGVDQRLYRTKSDRGLTSRDVDRILRFFVGKEQP